MIVRLTTEPVVEATLSVGDDARRFVLHRHRDREGPHLDLRLEQDGYLMGFRIDGQTLGPESFATVKAPHPVDWLEQDGEAVRADEGRYHWESGDGSGGVLVLCGVRETHRITVAPVTGVTADAVAALRAAAAEMDVPVGELVGLAEDGRVARERSVGRFCGLGRELDGDAFDDGLWRRTLAGERLAVVQQYLHGLELRFDRKYPPTPTSQPAPLEAEGADTGNARAMGILRGD